jgi:hypothetical protein
MELFYALEVGLERVGLTFALMLLPPWAVVPLTAISPKFRLVIQALGAVSTCSTST